MHALGLQHRAPPGVQSSAPVPRGTPPEAGPRTVAGAAWGLPIQSLRRGGREGGGGAVLTEKTKGRKSGGAHLTHQLRAHRHRDGSRALLHAAKCSHRPVTRPPEVGRW